ncbi:hypothetical protein L1987_72124 [Smallanthus sonchifolius]|uniref:Uncharacterized protein n=1 Tax=Smallanthus sonchifolius TaxID=185202 RepID=A0ACB9AVP6_9ASTR|nr:hypothetical protein L1987_72124 [Smallanthus sonchifolius]
MDNKRKYVRKRPLSVHYTNQLAPLSSKRMSLLNSNVCAAAFDCKTTSSSSIPTYSLPVHLSTSADIPLCSEPVSIYSSVYFDIGDCSYLQIYIR